VSESRQKEELGEKSESTLLQAAAAADLFEVAMLRPVFSRTRSRGGGWQITAVLLVLASYVAPGKIVAQVRPIRRVLIFYEIGLSSPSVSVLDQQIRGVLEDSPFQIELYREYLETTLFPDPKAQKEIREGYIQKYRDRHPDVVITVGPSPLRFLVDSHETFFKDVPVLFGGLSGAPLEDVHLDSHFTGVWDRVEPAETLEVALRLQPGTKHVVVVGGIDAFDLELEHWFRERLHRYEAKLDFTYLTDVPMPQLLERLKHLPAHTIILLAHIGLDAAGTHFVGASQADPMIVRAANVPVYGPSDVDLGHGEVGGYLDSFALQGKIMGQMAVSILKSERPQDIPVVKGSDVYMFDWQALKRWGLDEKKLPTGSIVLNRQPTVWELYQWYIISGIVLMILEALLIFGLLWQRARRKNAEADLAITFDRLRMALEAGRFVGWDADLRTGENRWFGDVKGMFGIPSVIFSTRLGEFQHRIHPEDLDRVTKAIEDARQNRQPYSAEFRIPQKGENVRWAIARGQFYYAKDGNPERMLGMAVDITERKLGEEALSTMSRRLIQAQEQERVRIARELHDHINQRLAMLQIDLDRIRQHASISDTELQVRIKEQCGCISEISWEVQAISHRLHSSKLEFLGLVAACRSFCAELLERQKLKVDFVAHGVPRVLPQEVSLVLFRVLQESLQNATKYSESQHFEVRLRGNDKEIQLTVRDNGKGFDVEAALNGNGLGLISMRERVNLVKGTIAIRSKRNCGTEVDVCIPIVKGNNEMSEVTSGAA
jgi:signal transduction histidine kinase